jgi:hypothetical protein
VLLRCGRQAGRDRYGERNGEKDGGGDRKLHSGPVGNMGHYMQCEA